MPVFDEMPSLSALDVVVMRTRWTLRQNAKNHALSRNYSWRKSSTCFWTPLSCTTLMIREAVRPLYWMVLNSVPTLSTLKASDQRQFPHPSMQMCSSCRKGQNRTNTKHRRHQTSEVSIVGLYLSSSKRQVNNRILCLEDFGRGGKGINKVPVYRC